MQDKNAKCKTKTPVGDYRRSLKIGIITGISGGEAMRKSFRRAAFSWLRSLFKQSARKDQDPGVDGAALPARIETTTSSRRTRRATGMAGWIFCESEVLQHDRHEHNLLIGSTSGPSAKQTMNAIAQYRALAHEKNSAGGAPP